MLENVKRISVSIIGVPVILGSIYLGGIYFFVVVSVISLVSQFEFYDIAQHKNLKINRIIGLSAGCGVLYLFYINRDEYFLPLLLLLSLYLLITEIFSERESALLNSSISLTGIIYPTAMIGTMYPLRQMDLLTGVPGYNLVVALLLGVWLCDTTAYFVGRAIGKHKLLERVSPNKTWEGSIAGFSASLIVISSLKYYGFLGISFTTVDMILLSIFTGIGSQLGDLFESLIKRDAGVKDSGILLPGHGGFLDRFDALIVAAPLTYLYFNYF